MHPYKQQTAQNLNAHIAPEKCFPNIFIKEEKGHSESLSTHNNILLPGNYLTNRKKGYCFLSNSDEDYNYRNFTHCIEIWLLLYK